MKIIARTYRFEYVPEFQIVLSKRGFDHFDKAETAKQFADFNEHTGRRMPVRLSTILRGSFAFSGVRASSMRLVN